MIKNNFTKLVLCLLLVTGLLFIIYFDSTGQNLLYADSISRLNISRKVIDNLTPGLPQLGNVWLPLPQLIMIPFIWVNLLWHTGIAGSITSLICFVLGGYYIYKSAFLISKSKVGSILSLSLYALNINLLYLQSTAMSESLFLCTLAATIYYFLMWFHTSTKHYLLLAALWMSAMTLTRYEGLAMLLPSIPLVFIYSYIKTRKYGEAEGNTIIYGTLAGLGFTLWTVYLTVIFGDPLYWKNYYATPQATGGAGEAVFTQAKPFLAATWQYLTSFIWMIGLIPTVFAALGVLVLLYQSARKRSWEFLPMLMPLSIFLFMVLTLQRNTPIVQPDLNWNTLLSGNTSLGTGFNIRYGILLLPWAAIVSAYVFQIRTTLAKIAIYSFFGIQLFSYVSPKYSVIYQIPARIYGKPYADLVSWFKSNYDGGLIFISASSHEDQMFEMGFNYSTYIHEGTGKYWKESLDDPDRYATWVVIDNGHPEDKIAKTFSRVDILERNYDLVYEKDQVKVFKKKTPPYFLVK